MKLVFIHGSGGTARVWKYQTERFPDSIAVTLPGHPDGEPCESVEDATRWLRSTLRARIGSEPLVLVGHSLGGAIALRYALDHGDELAGIVLVGSGARLRVHPSTLKALEQAIERPGTFDDVFAESFRKVAADFREELGGLARALGPAPFLNDLRACDRFDVVDVLDEIDVPTIAIAGTEDIMTPPKYSTFLETRMPNASSRIIDGGTHFVFAEYPEEVNDAISSFVSSLKAS